LRDGRGGENNRQKIPQKVKSSSRRGSWISVLKVEREKNTQEDTREQVIRTTFKTAVEVTVLPTQETIDRLASRIERAFYRRCVSWNIGCSTDRVWAAAAVNLWSAHQKMAGIPLDPELFVASQPIGGLNSDPWTALTESDAVQRYVRQVRAIIRLLRSELTREVSRANRLISRGVELSRVVTNRKLRLSALGCYIVALRAGRGDLLAEFHAKALEQHRSCPLYRIACLSFLSDDFYPGNASSARRDLPTLESGFQLRDALMN
jgi:hypothetical protein